MTIQLSLDLLRGSWSALPERSSKLAALELPASGLNIAVSANARHLLAVTTQSVRPPDVSSAVLTDRVVDLYFDGKGARYLDLACTDPALFDVFDELIIDIASVATGRAPGDSIQPVLTRWRSLFQVFARRFISRAARLGLFGELLVLERLASAYGVDVLSLWRGPQGAAHDFELPTGCLEVKSRGETSGVVTIHGVDQLDTHDSRPLHLLIETIREDVGGRAIRDVVDAIESVLGTGTLQPALAAVGFDSAAPEERFEVVDSIVVVVDDKVPRLVGSMTEHAKVITRVEYDVPISVLQQVRSNLDFGRSIGILMGGMK